MSDHTLHRWGKNFLEPGLYLFSFALLTPHFAPVFGQALLHDHGGLLLNPPFQYNDSVHELLN
jgi:hypothetical protein